MTSLRVAAVQASYVLMDRAATLDKVAGLTGEAAARGAQLVAFPEVFVPAAPIAVVETAGDEIADAATPDVGSGQRAAT